MAAFNQLKSENFRLSAVDGDLNRSRQQILELEESMKWLTEHIYLLENENGRRTMELQQKDEAIRQIDVDVREMQN